MNRSKCLLISAILGSLYLVYIIYYFFDAVSSSSGSEQIGADSPWLLCFLQEKFPHFCKNFSPGTGGEILCQPQQL
jgi:hypothetical protein